MNDVSGVDDTIETLCFGLWQVIKFAQEAYTTNGNEFLQALADRVMQTPYPIDPAEKCQYTMIKELATMLMRTRSNRR